MPNHLLGQTPELDSLRRKAIDADARKMRIYMVAAHMQSLKERICRLDPRQDDEAEIWRCFEKFSLAALRASERATKEHDDAEREYQRELVSGG